MTVDEMIQGLNIIRHDLQDLDAEMVTRMQDEEEKILITNIENYTLYNKLQEIRDITSNINIEVFELTKKIEKIEK